LSVVRILVVDDFEPWRHFVRSILQVTNVEIVDVASDGLEAVQKAEALQPELIVLDISLPKLEGIDAARRIRVVAPKSKILFLSQVSDPDVVRAALRVGARGYVVKDDAVKDLVAAVEAVVLGKHFFSKGLTGYDFSDLTQP
jgi:two-component system nitrate/nitrite response regulator NarL